jgi:phage gpG-like protein
MPDEVIKIDAGSVVLSLAAFRLGVAEKQDLLTTLAIGQRKSIYQTFSDEGSPAGSWNPLSEVSRRWRKYTAGHKLLIDSGRLRNSIGVSSQSPDSVQIGTNVAYAAVHQLGFDGNQNVRPYQYTRSNPFGDLQGKFKITNKLGHGQTVTRNTVSGVSFVKVKGFTRHIHIPARPFMVFRPEDPTRMATETKRFLNNRAKGAGLEVQ